MDEEDGGELLKSTVEALPLMQTLRMLSASHTQLEQAAGKVSNINSSIDELKSDSSDLLKLLTSLHIDRQQGPSPLVAYARKLSALVKLDAEHKFNIWRTVAENVRNALDVNDLEVAYRNLQELKRLSMHGLLLPSGNNALTDDDRSDASTSSAPNFDAVYVEFSQRLRQTIIVVYWTQLPKLDLSQTLKHVMILKSLGLDSHVELRVLFLNCRSRALDAQISRIKPSHFETLSASALDSKSSTTSQQQQLMPSAFIFKLIELHRSFLLDTVTHYNSLLLAEPQPQRSVDDAVETDAAENLNIFSNSGIDKNAAGRSVLYCWLDSRLDIFRQLVADFVEDPDSVQRMESIYSQLMYFGLSLARIYYDARLDFVALVENALMTHVDGVVKSATDQFVRHMQAATQRFTKLIWLLDASATFSPIADENRENSARSKFDAVQQQVVYTCKTILERFCRHIQHEALDTIRSCALQTLSVFVYKRIVIEALDTLHAQVRELTRLTSAAASDKDDDAAEQKPSRISFKPVTEMAIKIDQHLRACVEICYPLDELRQQQMAGANFSVMAKKLSASFDVVQSFYDRETSPVR